MCPWERSTCSRRESSRERRRYSRFTWPPSRTNRRARRARTRIRASCRSRVPQVRWREDTTDSRERYTAQLLAENKRAASVALGDAGTRRFGGTDREGVVDDQLSRIVWNPP